MGGRAFITETGERVEVRDHGEFAAGFLDPSECSQAAHDAVHRWGEYPCQYFELLKRGWLRQNGYAFTVWKTSKLVRELAFAAAEGHRNVIIEPIHGQVEAYRREELLT